MYVISDAMMETHVLPIPATVAHGNAFQIAVKDLHAMFMVNAFLAEI
jgi:hypothetical protein